MPKKIQRELPELKLTDDKTVGERVSDLRKSAGLSQLQLSEKLGIDRKLLSNYETGKCRVYDEMIIRLADAFGVSTDNLLGYEKKDNETDNSISLRYTKRIREIEALPDHKKKVLLRSLDDMIKALKS